MIAEIGAKKGRTCPTTSVATSHASEAAPAHCAIGTAVVRSVASRPRTRFIEDRGSRRSRSRPCLYDAAVALPLAQAVEPASKTAFYVGGGLLAVWAVVLSALGLSRPDFPRGQGAGRLVLLVSA